MNILQLEDFDELKKRTCAHALVAHAPAVLHV